MKGKADARKFLLEFEQQLNSALPFGSAIDDEVRRIISAAKGNLAEKHKTGPEYAFVNHYVMPMLHSCVAAQPGYSKKIATQAVLSEFFAYMPDLSSGTPARPKSHPFGKAALGLGARRIMERWKGGNGQKPLTQSCPDFALREPFRIVFEGKYFRLNSVAAAEKALVDGIFEAFLYRALPIVETTKRRPAWDYDYACLIAFDASESGVLYKAWDALSEKVRESFWDSGNLHVMILRGAPNSPK